MTNSVSGVGRFRLERRPNSLPVAMRELSDRLVTLRRAVRSAEWNAVFAASLDALGAARAHLPAIANLEAEAAETLAFHVERAEAFTTAFQALAERADRVEVVANLRAQLTAADPGLAQRLDVVLTRIEAGERTFPSVAPAIDTMVPTQAPADLAIAAASRGLRGLAHHAFNTVADPPPDIGTALAMLEEFEGLLTHRESLLRDAQTRLFDVIKAGRPGDVVADEAQQLAATVEQFVAGFAAAQARVAPVAGALRDAGRGTDAEKVGMRLAMAGLLGREAFASHAAALALVFELRKFRQSPNARRVLDMDEDVVFDRALPSGTRTEMARLSSVPEGTLVQIRGFATAFVQRRSADGKLLSQVTLLESVERVVGDRGRSVHPPSARRSDRGRLRGRPRVCSNEFTAARERCRPADRRLAARGARQALLAVAAVGTWGAVGRDVAQRTAPLLVARSA